MANLLLVVIYLSFISLGLPDSLLGAAWPSVYPEMHVPVSYAGIISIIIAAGTIISALSGNMLLKKFGASKVTAVSVAISALTLLGFSFARRFWVLCLLALPYGLAAGSIDAGLNNYVALHYSSRHMSWLHCMWGIGTIVGPYIMGLGLTHNLGWQFGYKIMAALQATLLIVVVLSLPLWKKVAAKEEDEEADVSLTLGQALKFPGAMHLVLAFFCYCALEQTTMLWAGSYMSIEYGASADAAAMLSSLFFIGITAGRAINGFLTFKLSDDVLIFLGQAVIGVGIIFMLLPFGMPLAIAGLVLIGLGCAPIYPCIIHSTPDHFGKVNSQAMISVQIAGAYTGTCLAPPTFGIIANHASISLMPIYLIVILIGMFILYRSVLKHTAFFKPVPTVKKGIL